MSAEDPIAKVIATLPDAPIDAGLRDRVEAEARAALVQEGRGLARFDRWTLDRLVPVALAICATVYTVGLVQFLGNVYVAHRG
jgi:hypothetical protein